MDNSTWMIIFASLIGVDIYQIVKDAKNGRKDYLASEICILIICIVCWLINCAEFFDRI